MNGQSQISIQQAFTFAWNTIKTEWVSLLRLALLNIVLSVIAIFGVVGIVATPLGLVGLLTKIITGQVPVAMQNAGALLGALGLILLGLCIFTLIKLYITNALLAIHDKRPWPLAAITALVSCIIPAIVSNVLYSLIVTGGTILFIIPGIIWAIQFGFFMYSIVDLRCGAIQALKHSSRITYGHKWTLFLFNVIRGLLVIPVQALLSLLTQNITQMQMGAATLQLFNIPSFSALILSITAGLIGVLFILAEVDLYRQLTAKLPEPRY